jgi:CubicO group peptidase (beta-lactamase class C family)
MTVSAADASGALIERVRARPWGLAVVAIRGDDQSIGIDRGADPLTEASLFQIGSITKTMTGVLLADCVGRGETALDTTVGDLLSAFAGTCGAITLAELATQRSGLPRLPPNLDTAAVDPLDPYAAYTRADLLAALDMVDPPVPGTYAYSNFGFMLLGALLAEITGTAFPDLIASRLFEPLGMTTAGCPPAEAGRAPGYSGATEVPWWRTNLPGPGGVGASIVDLATYLRAHLDPDRTPLARAIELATETHAEGPSAMGLGWGHQGGGSFHDGGTGGFTSFAAFHRPTRTAVGLLANSADANALTATGFAVLTEMVRSA